MNFASLEIIIDLGPYKIYVLIFHEIVFIYRILPGHATHMKLVSIMVFVFIETVKKDLKKILRRTNTKGICS